MKIKDFSRKSEKISTEIYTETEQQNSLKRSYRKMLYKQERQYKNAKTKCDDRKPKKPNIKTSK